MSNSESDNNISPTSNLDVNNIIWPESDLASDLDLTDWIHKRIQNIIDLKRPVYEASWYGPVNSRLVTVFPTDQQFMVKPQPKLRPLVPNQSEDPDQSFSSIKADAGDANVSLDSYLGAVEAHGHNLKKNLGMQEPDFLVVKIHPDGSQRDIILAVIEVKRSVSHSHQAWDQIMGYLLSVNKRPYRASAVNVSGKDCVLGMLIMGPKTRRIDSMDQGFWFYDPEDTDCDFGQRWLEAQANAWRKFDGWDQFPPYPYPIVSTDSEEESGNDENPEFVQGSSTSIVILDNLDP